ncbi:MAG TPA: HK97 gp10 family phage protein [Pirellulales bacterium]|nr:HK97 gp10 family phage protein [Pirellulales bacterium]
MHDVITFEPNPVGIRECMADLQAAGQQAIDGAWQALREGGSEYQRRVVAAAPVRTGLLQKSLRLVQERSESIMSITLSADVRSPDGRPYAVYLEFGTARIAGGKVKTWQPYEEPILAWPAKQQALADLRMSRTSVAADARRLPPNRAAQLPFMRPIGWQLAPQISAAVRTAVQQAFDAR